MCLCHSVLSVSFVFHCCMKQRTSRFEKAMSRQQKILIMKKHYTHMLHRFTNFLDNKQQQQICLICVVDESTGKENVSYTRHRNTTFIERVTKQILICFSIYSLQSALPKMFMSQNVNNLVFETSNLPQSSSVKIRRKIQFLIK